MLVHHSLALATVINEMVAESSTILDLGSMSTGTTGAFLKLRCKCYVEDLNEYIDELQLSGGDPIEHLEQHLIKKPENLKFDVVLCWDVLNYLSPKVLEFLMKQLTPYFKEGTILHTMRYVGNTMPVKPGKFRVEKGLNFELVQDSDTPRVPSSVLSTASLLKHMGTFTMRKTLINQAGMQSDITEHLLEYGHKALAKNLKRSTQSRGQLFESQGAAYEDISMPGLSFALQKMQKMSNNSILEAGKKSGRQMSILNQLTENFFIEDVYSLMSWHRKIAVNSSTSFSDNTLLFPAETSFNFVLLWDLLNFLNTAQAEKMLLLLERNLIPGSLIHCVIFKTEGTPEHPAQFFINQDLSISIKGDVKGENPRSISNTAQLMSLMSRFRMTSSHFGNLGRNDNFLEFLFEFRG